MPSVVPPPATSADLPLFRLTGARLRAGERFEARVRLSMEGGWQIVAHEVRATDLVGLAVSVPDEDVLVSAPRYPEPKAIRGVGSMAPFAVHEGEAIVAIPLSLRPGAVPGERRLRLRVVVQPCDAAACRPPDSATLEVPLTVDPRR